MYSIKYEPPPLNVEVIAKDNYGRTGYVTRRDHTGIPGLDGFKCCAKYEYKKMPDELPLKGNIEWWVYKE